MSDTGNPAFDESRIFARFTSHARTIVRQARLLAAARGTNEVDAGHILFALVDEKCGFLADLLRTLKVDVARLRMDCEVSVARVPGVGVNFDRPHWDPQARRALLEAERAADNLGDKMIGTGPLLLGLLNIKGGMASSAMMRLGLSPEGIREVVFEVYEFDKDDDCLTPFSPFEDVQWASVTTAPVGKEPTQTGGETTETFTKRIESNEVERADDLREQTSALDDFRKAPRSLYYQRMVRGTFETKELRHRLNRLGKLLKAILNLVSDEDRSEEWIAGNLEAFRRWALGLLVTPGLFDRWMKAHGEALHDARFDLGSLASTVESWVCRCCRFPEPQKSK